MTHTLHQSALAYAGLFFMIHTLHRSALAYAELLFTTRLYIEALTLMQGYFSEHATKQHTPPQPIRFRAVQALTHEIFSYHTQVRGLSLHCSREQNTLACYLRACPTTSSHRLTHESQVLACSLMPLPTSSNLQPLTIPKTAQALMHGNCHTSTWHQLAGVRLGCSAAT